MPADPEPKGGSEAAVRVAKADLVPTAANLVEDYSSWASSLTPPKLFRKRSIPRTHRATHRPSAEMLEEEEVTQGIRDLFEEGKIWSGELVLTGPKPVVTYQVSGSVANPRQVFESFREAKVFAESAVRAAGDTFDG